MADAPADRNDLAAPAAGAAEVAETARTGEPDRYLAALLAPEPERSALIALAAFSTELARIPHRAVREPFMGQIRLQWWRDVLKLAPGESAGHAVADAVRFAVRRHHLPQALLEEMIDARALELVPTPFGDDAAVDDFLRRTDGALFALACRVGGLTADRGTEAACAAAARAYGLVRLLVGLPRTLALGRIPLAKTRLAAAGLSAHELLAGVGGPAADALVRAYIPQVRASHGEARELVRRLPPASRRAFLPLALVRPYVRLLERRGGAALREAVEIVPLTRVWRIAAAHLLGRL